MATNLYEYYTKKGQTLPSVQERVSVATEAGISGYSGTAEQNVTLLQYLKSRDAGSQINNLSQIEQPVSIDRLNSGEGYNLPEPEAYDITSMYTRSATENAQLYRDRLEKEYAQKQEEANRKIAELEKREQEHLKSLDPTQRATYAQEQRIMQNELDAAEEASRTVAQDFQKRRAFVDELETIMMENNAILQREANMPLSSRVLSRRVSDVMRDNNARAGVVEATIAALDGNISQAHNIMNQAKNSVAADWNDKVNYHNTLLSLDREKLIRLDNESKEYAMREIALMEDDLARMNKTVDYITAMMIDPQTAQFIASAGVKMTDTIEEINEKLSKQALQEEREQMINDLTMRGYKYVVAPTSTAGLVPITIGGQTLYFRQPVDTKGVTKERKSTLTENERRELFSLGMTSKEIEEFEMSIEMLGLNRALEELKKKYTGGSSTEEQIDSAVDQVREMYLRKIGDTTDYSSMDIVDLETGIRNLLPESELAYIAKKLGYKGGIFSIDSKRVSKMFEGLTRGQMITLIREASRGTSGDETVKLLGSSTEPK